MKATVREEPPQNESFVKAGRLHSAYCAVLPLTMVYSVVMSTPWQLRIAALVSSSAVIDILLALVVTVLDILYHNFRRDGERIRRSALIDDAFGTRLFVSSADGYYDTDGVDGGVGKLLANVHQSSLYTREITRQMLRRSYCVVVIWSLTWIILNVTGFGHSPVSTVALKIWLSYVVLGRCLNLRHLYSESESVVNTAAEIWADRLAHGEDTNFVARALSVILRYETAISESGIALNSKIKSSLDDRPEQEWSEIRQRYQIGT